MTNDRELRVSVQLGQDELTHLEELGLTLKHDVLLAPYTTMKIGGPADYFVTVTELDHLRQIVTWARRVGLPYFLLGGGSNMLISDVGVRGLVIYNRSRRVEFLPDDSGTGSAAIMVAESGAVMAGAARQSVNRGLTGLEWAVSVPGTVGGATVGNAGAYDGDIKDSLVSADVLIADGAIRRCPVDDFDYSYRSSSLKRMRPLQAGFHPVVLCARFRLKQDDLDQVQARAASYLSHRRSTQPVEPSLGSTFVNPPGDYAGRMIEAAGLKGAKVGGVEISRIHANFIINPGGVGGATAADVMRLIQQVQAKVREDFDVLLQPEIQLAGEW